jgi:ferritin-like protein
MVTIARVVENVGVGAYLGAAHLVQDPRVLTAAASIVTIESRHQTILNIFESASPISQSFDLPLLPNEVLAIAGSFIKGCDLGIPGTHFPALHYYYFSPSKLTAFTT